MSLQWHMEWICSEQELPFPTPYTLKCFMCAGPKDQILRELVTFMASDPTVIEPSIRLIRISRSLERIADLSTNICEDVIYMAEGRMIKHGKNTRACETG
jgi:hypothetical protein